MIEERKSLGQVEVVALTGNLDASVAVQVGDALKSMINEGHSRMILDLESIRFVDSSGLSTLVSVLKAARREGGDVVLLRIPATVRPIIELTRLDRVFAIASDVEAAQASFSGHGPH